MTTQQITQDHVRLSEAFLSRARGYLAEDDLQQASEKGWGAAAHMVKAVAVAQGWDYEGHAQFFQVMHRAGQSLGDDRLHDWGNSANSLHGFFYMRKMLLNSETIGRNLNAVESLINALEPLVAAAPTA